MKRICADADVQPVLILVEFIGPWPAWKTMAVDDQDLSSFVQQFSNNFRKSSVMRPIICIQELGSLTLIQFGTEECFL